MQRVSTVVTHTCQMLIATECISMHSTVGLRAEVCHLFHVCTCCHQWLLQSLLETLYSTPWAWLSHVAANERECVRVESRSTGSEVNGKTVVKKSVPEHFMAIRVTQKSVLCFVEALLGSQAKFPSGKPVLNHCNHVLGSKSLVNVINTTEYHKVEFGLCSGSWEHALGLLNEWNIPSLLFKYSTRLSSAKTVGAAAAYLLLC